MSTKYYRDKNEDFWKIEDNSVCYLSTKIRDKNSAHYRNWMNVYKGKSIDWLHENEDWIPLIEITSEQFFMELL